MYLLAIFLPLFSALLIGLFGRFIGQIGVKMFSVCMLFLSNLLALFIFYYAYCYNIVVFVKCGSWFQSNLLIVNWGFCFDSVTCTILVVITTISSLVHLYSCSYIKTDPHIIRFLISLSFFTFFMLILVVSDNFLQLFLGWEGVGFCSYLLINFWFTRLQANKAALKAMLINRIGDIFILLGISILVYKFQSLDFIIILSLVPYIIADSIYLFGCSVNCLFLLTFFLFIGVVGKSAQFGLHTWLPDAIEGPTPVSALLHAATIVTAGVFLFVRCSFLFEYASLILSLSSFWGLLTALFAATCALLQNDIKKIIAYSTCSQLGYIVFICGLSQYSVGLFHLFNHAFFKALLFLGAGIVIHFITDNQDIRQIGFIKIFLPTIFIIMFVGTLALLGFPFLTGFYSKDLILELVFTTTFFIDNVIILWLALITTLLTALYSVRLLYFVFLGSAINTVKIYTLYFHYPSLLLRVPLYVLFFCSLFIGFFFKDLFVSFGSPFFSDSIFILPEHCTLVFSEFLPVYIKIIPFICSCVGIILFYFFNSFNLFFNKSFFMFFSFKWYIDKFYSLTSAYFFKIFYSSIYILFDKGVIELFGPAGITIFLINVSSKLLKNSSGYFFSYICIGIIGSLFIFSFLVLYF